MAQPGSFIPQQQSTKAAPVRKRRKIYVFTYISYVVFFGTILAAGGILVYEHQLNKQLDTQKALLAEQRTKFAQSDLERIRELEQKLIAANLLLDTHVAPSRLLADLERVTIQPVQLTAFSLEREVNGSYMLTIDGGTDSFDSLLAQRNTFDGLTALAGVAITDVSYGQTDDSDDGEFLQNGNVVTFTLNNNLSTRDFAYEGAVTPPAPAPVTTAELDQDAVLEANENAADVVDGSNEGGDITSNESEL